jgi:hypothetical protein
MCQGIFYHGIFYGIIDFDGGASTQELIATNPGDIFISKLKADGSYGLLSGWEMVWLLMVIQ